MEHQSVLATLGIDWRQLLAQFINFGIVVFVVWKWIATPLVKALTERQRKISEGLRTAEELQRQKLQFEDWKLRENRKMQVRTDEMLRQAADEATKVKQSIIADAQKDASRLLADTRLTLESDKQRLIAEAKEEIATMVVVATEKILREKIDEKKDHELIKQALKGLK